MHERRRREREKSEVSRIFYEKTLKIGSKHAHKDAPVKMCQNDALTNTRFARAPYNTTKMCASTEGASEKVDVLRVFYEKNSQSWLKTCAQGRACQDVPKWRSHEYAFFARAPYNTTKMCAGEKIGVFTDILRKKKHSKLSQNVRIGTHVSRRAKVTLSRICVFCVRSLT